MTRISANGVSPGIGAGKAYLLKKNIFKIPREPAMDKSAEFMRFELALKKVSDEAGELLARAGEGDSGLRAEILDAYVALLGDPETTNGVRELIDKSYNAAFAVSEAIGGLAKMFEGLEDDYIRERAFDIRDIMNALLRELLGIKPQELKGIPPGSVLIAHDLAVSDTAKINMDNLEGIITVLGGENSHMAIVARGFEIPAVVGAQDILELAAAGDEVLLDGSDGTVYLSPTPDIRQGFMERRSRYLQLKENYGRFIGKTAVTLDGVKVEVLANINDPGEVKKAADATADGVGLFRSEFLYMDREDFPGEEDQFNAYRQVAAVMEGKPVTIRTMDVGGDKRLSYMGLEKEDNPYLGYRAIRIGLSQNELLRTQLRAILRAGACGSVRALIPFISSVGEMRDVREVFKEVKAALKREGVPFDGDLKLGAMIEVPSAAILAKELAAECDFFAIGTNDLIQYTLAVDRGNQKVAGLYTHYHPAVLRLINHVIKSAGETGTPCCVCGEAAGDTKLIPALLGMGLRSFSVSAGSVLRTRAVISSSYIRDAEVLAAKVLSCATKAEVLKAISEFSAGQLEQSRQ